MSERRSVGYHRDLPPAFLDLLLPEGPLRPLVELVLGSDPKSGA